RGGPERTPDVADAAIQSLQFFDRLSLWICVAERREPAELPTPDGPPLRMVPHEGGRIAMDPWPLTTGPVELSISGRRIPAMRYADAAALAAAPHEPVTLRVTLMPK